MKVLWLTISLAVLAAALVAQTGSPSSAKPERAPTVITSDAVDFDLNTRLAVYRGNVRVEDPGMTLTCGVLTAKVPERGGKIESIVAEQNVVVEAPDENGRLTHGTCAKLVYTYSVAGSVTNEIVELTGEPLLTNPSGSLVGDLIIWNKASGKVSGRNVKMKLIPGGTNSIPSLLSQPPGAKN